MFRNCKNLTHIIANGFFGDRFDGETFAGCTSLEHIPSIHVHNLSNKEFDNCCALKSIHLGNGLTRIGSYCFRNCRSLTDVYIPDTVEFFASGIFMDCCNLKSVHLPKTMTQIPDIMFDGCEKLQKVFLADTITKIGNRAFARCASLNNPWIPEALEEIGDHAFEGCRSIRSIMLPPSIKKIGEDAFAECQNLSIKCVEGSYAHQYAKTSAIAYTLV